MTEPRTYWLPWPVSVNALWRANRGQNILSEAGRRWFKSATNELHLQRPEAIKGPVEIRIQLKAPTRRKYDPDNRVKASLDALVKSGIIEGDDDRIVRKISVEVAGQDWDVPFESGALVTVRNVEGNSGSAKL